MESEDSSSGHSIKPLSRHAEASEGPDQLALDTEVPVTRSVSYSDGMSPSNKAMIQSNKRKNKAADEDLHMKLRTQLDAEIARMFYSSGLSFKLARNPYYVRLFSTATSNEEEDESQNDWHSLALRMFCYEGLSFTVASNPYYRSSFAMAAMLHIPGYVPPGYDQLKTTLLQKERADIENTLQTIKNTWGKAGVTIVSDGWSDAQRRPVINTIAVNENGPVFLEAINNEDDVKTKEYIAEKLITAIEDVGSENVVQVITDNDPVCRDAGVLIEQKYNHIQWTPSVAHSLSLALENICAAKNADNVVFKDCHWISEVIGGARMINDFINDHTMVLSMISDFSKLKMLGIADTRFASDIVMLKRFRLIKQSIIGMVISDKWSVYSKDDEEQAQLVKKKLTDELWWDQVDYILAFTEPIYSMIRSTDTEKQCIHLIYEMWNDMIEKVKAIIYRHEGKRAEEESTFYSVIKGVLADWWDKTRTPLHCLAHALNPRCYTNCWIDECANRQPPYNDSEINEMANDCLKKLFPAADDLRAIETEYAKFSLLGTEFAFSGAGCFSLDSITDRDLLGSKTWWVTHGSSTPKLQELALTILGHPASASCCERNWTTYKLIRTIMKLESLLRPKWADDLVFVHTNLRLLTRTSKFYYTDPESMLWDVGGDAGYLASCVPADFLEFAELSLDEPEFEFAVLEMMEDDNLA